MTLSIMDQYANKEELKTFKCAKHLWDSGVKSLPEKYILPESERPEMNTKNERLCLPVIDISALEKEGVERDDVLKQIGDACEKWGFFQVINHGIDQTLVEETARVNVEFFNLPQEEKNKYMTPNVFMPVRYGTSLNQAVDVVFCWRDFIKLVCLPFDKMIPLWPTTPSNYRENVGEYSMETRKVALRLMGAVLQSLGLPAGKYVGKSSGDDNEGQMMVMNYYPACPDPSMTLGLHAHSDFGSLTVLYQDCIGGLQIRHDDRWVDVVPLPNSFVVNVGDQFEIISNGRYRSVLHRVVGNTHSARLSMATLMSMPYEAVIEPAEELVDEEHPALYRKTCFKEFAKLAAENYYRPGMYLESVSVKPNTQSQTQDNGHHCPC